MVKKIQKKYETPFPPKNKPNPPGLDFTLY